MEVLESTGTEQVVESEAVDTEKAQDALYPNQEKVEDKDVEPKAEEGKDNAAPEGEDKELEAKEGDKADGEDKKAEVKDADAPITAEHLNYPKDAEGKVVEINKEVEAKFLGLINDKDMAPAERAQAFVDLQQSINVIQAEAQEAVVSGWEKEIKEDVEFGGDKFDENMSKVREVVKVHGSEKFQTLLNDRSLGIGSNPEFLKFVLPFHSLTANDTIIKGSPAAGQPQTKTIEQKMYPGHFK